MSESSSKLIKPGHLLAGWAAYWSVLAAATLWRPALIAWRVSRPEANGSITAGFDNSKFFLTMARDGQTVLEQAATAGQIAAWIVVPPLLILGTWMLFRSREQRRLEAIRVAELEAGHAPASPILSSEREYADRHDS